MEQFEFSNYSIPAIVVATTMFSLGVFVLTRNSKSGTHRALFLQALCLSLWLFTYGLMYSARQSEIARALINIGYLAVIFIPVTFYHFAYHYVELYRHKKWLVIAYLVSGVFTSLLWFTDLFVSGMTRYFWGYYPKAGLAHPAFMMFFSTLYSTAVWCILRTLHNKAHQLSISERNRTRLVVAAFGLAFIASMDFLPNYGVAIYPFGYLFIGVEISLLAYAIVRHQLLDIEVIVKRTAVFAGMALGMMAMIAVPTFVAQTWLARGGTANPMILNLISIGLIMLTYERMKRWLVDVTDRFLFQKSYDYKTLLKTFTDEVMVMVDLKQLVQMTVNTLTETVKLEGCQLYLLDKDQRTYDPTAHRGGNGHALVFEEQEPFIAFLRETHEPIAITGPLAGVKFPEQVTERVKQLNARLVLPLNLHEDLIGVLCLGKKKSDEEFTKDDLDILQPLARTLAIAVSNAQLFVELAKTQAEAAQKEKLAVIGTLSAGINHEICNPLGIVKAQCEAFLLDSEDGILIGKSAQELLDRTTNIMRVALKQIDRATAITQKLSNFAKPIKEAKLQSVVVEQEVDEVILLVGHDLKLEKIEVIKELEPGLPQINVDRRQLQEVLFNLIRNAGQAITPPGMIWVRAKTDGKLVRIEITDTGSGISPDKLGKIYDPFFTTKEPGKGTGLGLFIVRQIVERNKGRISVESAVGKGTTFFLEFPAAAAAVPTGK